MSKSVFQYVGEGHTLVRTLKNSAEKVKVVQGEAVEIEEGIYSDSRLMMAGFQKIVDGIGDVINGAADVIEGVIDGVQDIKEALENKEEENKETPSVEVTAKEDGKDEVTIEVKETKPDRNAIMEELTVLGVTFKKVGESTDSLVAKLAEAKAK